MKHSTFKKAISLLLSVLLLGAGLTMIIPIHAANDISIQNGTGTREAIRVGSTYSYRAIVNGTFTGFGFSMPTYLQTGCYATLSLYKWAGSYDATVAGEPVASKAFTSLADGETNWVTFAAQPAGEYLFHISDVSENVGVWTNSSPTDSKGVMYLNGEGYRGEPSLNIRFSQALEEPFGTCDAAGDVRTTILPFTPTSGVGVTQTDGPMGYQLNVDSSFAGVQFKIGTYMSNDTEADITVYQWDYDYEVSVSAEPVAKGRITLVDNETQGISFDPLPAGEYLFLLENCSKSVALYTYSSVSHFKGTVYAGGVAIGTTAYPLMQLTVCEEKNSYFLECSDPSKNYSGDHTAPDEYVIPEDSLINTHPVKPSTWVFTDGLGRVSLTNAEVGDPKEDKTLAMFYWTWHIDGFANEEAVNLQKLSEQYPEAMNDWDNPLWNNYTSSQFFWDEPIWGYYRGDDKWVLRRQAELLTNAGVDVIFTDNTNLHMTWKNSYDALLEEWNDAMEDGLKTPKLSFMLPFTDLSYTNLQLRNLYQDIFYKNKYQNLWFYWDGKPMIMAMQAAVNSEKNNLEKEIYNFFTYRAGQPSYVVDNTVYKNWGWLSMYPQALYYKNNGDKKSGNVEQMTVGVAMNHNYVTGTLDAMNGDNIAGRSYTSTDPDRYAREGAEASKWGYNFAEQWSYALEVDPQVVFVTGWNEYRVGRYETWGNNTENAFPDQYNDEFSRDIEPTKGELKDHYYYQLVNFVRQYKGCEPIPTPSTSKTIDLSAGYEQWKSVEPYYAAYIGNTEDRDSDGYGDLHYTETSGRNDIIGAQIARDDDYLYCLVECAEDITPCTDSLWMNLYLDTDQTNQGWETFEYVVRGSESGKMTLEKFSGTGYESGKVTDVEYTLDGRYLTVKIAKSDLGLAGHDYTINFTWTDNVHDEGDYTTFSGDIMDFYISGDVAPGGRFKYSYISTTENAGVSDTETEPGSETATATETQPATDAEPTDTAAVPTETDTESTQDSGCQSAALPLGLPVLVALCALPLLRRRRRSTAQR